MLKRCFLYTICLCIYIKCDTIMSAQLGPPSRRCAYNRLLLEVLTKRYLNV